MLERHSKNLGRIATYHSEPLRKPNELQSAPKAIPPSTVQITLQDFRNHEQRRELRRMDALSALQTSAFLRLSAEDFSSAAPRWAVFLSAGSSARLSRYTSWSSMPFPSSSPPPSLVMVSGEVETVSDCDLSFGCFRRPGRFSFPDFRLMRRRPS